ncbi:MAG TPA: FAD-dependent oxidoreductase [Firmicutes bacterium]|nr:FAD-dependent oxidoreductase [Bacillota bacterium]
MGKKVIIVGGVAGGASTAARLRRLDESCEIILLERGEHISFANCGLPYYIGGVIKERDKLFVMPREKFMAWFNVDVRVSCEAVAIDRARRKVEIENKVTGERSCEQYDYLVLSPGAEPLKPPLPGIDHPAVFTLRTVPETDRIYSFIREQQPQKAVIVGGGFIGVEMAENLHALGIDVALVEMAPQILPFLDWEMAAHVQQYLRQKGVKLVLGDGVAGFADGTGSAIAVSLQSGRVVEADFVLLAAGVRPETRLAREAGLEVGRGILVNEYLQTSDPRIYALGDAIEVVDFITGKRIHLPLAGPANRQGRIVANNIAGRPEKFTAVQGTAILKVFDLVAAATGAGERALQKAGLPYHSCVLHPASHAGYYPGSSPMVLKLLFGPGGQLYGAQAVGGAGVDKRIDVLAAAIRLRATVSDLQQLELTYAPPFSSAKDPVNMAGYVAGNILAGDVQIITAEELIGGNVEGLQLVDVREPEECSRHGRIPGAVNIPLRQLRRRLGELDPAKETVVYCAAGMRSYLAYRILVQHGFTHVRNLSGGYTHYHVLAKEKQAAAQ